MAFEMYCYRRMMRISWTQKKTNKEICDEVCVKVDILQRAIQRKLRLFGHICRMDDSRKLKTIVFGIIEGSNRKGRPCREWADDITDWCKSGLYELSEMTQDRILWKSVIKCALDTNGRWSHG